MNSEYTKQIVSSIMFEKFPTTEENPLKFATTEFENILFNNIVPKINTWYMSSSLHKLISQFIKSPNPDLQKYGIRLSENLLSQNSLNTKNKVEFIERLISMFVDSKKVLDLSVKYNLCSQFILDNTSSVLLEKDNWGEIFIDIVPNIQSIKPIITAIAFISVLSKKLEQKHHAIQAAKVWEFYTPPNTEYLLEYSFDLIKKLPHPTHPVLLTQILDSAQDQKVNLLSEVFFSYFSGEILLDKFNSILSVCDYSLIYEARVKSMEQFNLVFMAIPIIKSAVENKEILTSLDPNLDTPLTNKKVKI